MFMRHNLEHDTLEGRLIKSIRERLTSNKAHDSDKLDAELAEKGVGMIAPIAPKDKKPKTEGSCRESSAGGRSSTCSLGS
jgi:hypothetical protein